jgi:hypothetical protein
MDLGVPRTLLSLKIGVMNNMDINDVAFTPSPIGSNNCLESLSIITQHCALDNLVNPAACNYTNYVLAQTKFSGLRGISLIYECDSGDLDDSMRMRRQNGVKNAVVAGLPSMCDRNIIVFRCEYSWF